ncbi:MAG: tRNA (adenosine(37)-N6)-dimethylallyltransferase MiaA [Candidatus Omnitrophica bacterium]|nr:tRNA (adenosine(37)-N6)-dimethylallyltransferase MiaA [Candidatus Omnitrophota bacterium]
MKKNIIFLVGPTAVGKSECAVKFAKKINAEIISCDSMQIYKGMDILTSKPHLVLRKKIPHHLISLISPQKEFNASQYRKIAIREIGEIYDRGKIPLFVGGTGLYMSVLIDGIFDLKTENKIIRSHLEKEAKAKGSSHLYKKLKKIDLLAAQKIHPNDLKRIIRALEVFEVTGSRISELQTQKHGLGENYDIKIFCLDMGRQELYKKINARVERMFKQGLAAEVKKLLKLKLSRTARYAIGLREIKRYLDGEYDLESAKESIKRNTRRYAKRQLTWFRKDKRIRWIKVEIDDSPKVIAERIIRLL